MWMKTIPCMGISLQSNDMRCHKVCLAQLLRFLMVKLTHLGLNHIFDMSVAFTVNYSFSGRCPPSPSIVMHF
jgi:hypothetical protein